MTTISLTWKQARAARVARKAKQRPVLLLLVSWLAAHLPSAAQARSMTFRVGGLTALCLAGYSHSLTTGLVVTGFSLLLLEWLAEKK